MKNIASIAIVGAGITGLAAAFELKKRGLPVQVFEAGDRAGGVIRTVRRQGYQVECGPNTLMETDPRIPEFIREIGLGGEMIYSNPEAGKRWIIRGGKLVPMPGSPVDFFAGELFSAKAKLRLMAEPFIRRSPPEWDESLAQFVVRRLGPEFLDYAIDPFVSGVYAGNPAKLSVREAFGKVHQLEQRYGSLILGQILGARERRKSGAVSKQNAPKVSFKSGLATLTETLAERLAGEIHYRHALASLARQGSEWALTFNSPAGAITECFSAVLVTAPAHVLAQIPIETHPAASFEFLNAITYAPISTLAFGFRRDQVRHPLDGFGFLVPGVEKLNVLGAIFGSSLFPQRAPDGHVLIGTFLGGLRAPEVPFRPAGEQIDLALHDLRNLLGITGQPAFTHHLVYTKAIPQYDVGYSAIRHQIETVETRCPGLFLGGNYRGGISLSDSLLNGLGFGARISDFLETVADHEHAIAA